MNAYRSAVRPLLFRFDPERVHHATTAACRVVGRLPPALALIERWYGTPADPRLVTDVAGVTFPNPVGLSAGYDKNGAAVATLSRLGFGYIDVGSVSNAPSAGNPGRPRLFRLPADDALMVHYGVPSDGAAIVAQRLAGRPARIPLGVTVVETNTGHPNDAPAVIAEIAAALARFRDSADLLFISAACPNETSGAQPFSDLDNLQRLFETIGRSSQLPPVFLKIKADTERIERIVAMASAFPFIKGFQPSVAPPRPYVGLNTPAREVARMPGTATGPYVTPYLLAALRNWRSRIDPRRHVLIANGGIRTGADAYAAIRSGASLVGLVTALVYEGPGLARRINNELSTLLERDGFAHVADAVGADHPPAGRLDVKAFIGAANYVRPT